MNKWQSSWEFGDFARNIPSLESVNGNIILGFPPEIQLQAFLTNNDSLDVTSNFAACVSAPKHIIGKLNHSPTSHFSLPKELLATTHCSDFKTLLLQVQDKTLTIDCILMIGFAAGRTTCNIIRSIGSDKDTRNTPIIFIHKNFSDEQLIKVYQSGVSDCISQDTNPEIISHKINIQLRLKRSLDILEITSRIDALTELSNRRDFNHIFMLEWEKGLREKSSLALMIIDIDDFKSYNDHYGHKAGDACLNKMGKILSYCITRSTDHAFRYGGEEFAILLPSTGHAGALKLAHLIKHQLAIHDIKHAHACAATHITVSIGINTLIPSKKSNKELFFQHADKALYQAKNQGKNQPYVYEPMDETPSNFTKSS